jgi:WXG100 protein secretion system (Wss), protein YukD
MADIEFTVHTADGRKHVVEVPADINAAEFLHELEAGLELATVDAEGNPIEWSAHNKDLGRALDREKSLEENGVRRGSHLRLYVRESPQFLRAEASATPSAQANAPPIGSKRPIQRSLNRGPLHPPKTFFHARNAVRRSSRM